jgi:copper resistance protein B
MRIVGFALAALLASTASAAAASMGGPSSEAAPFGSPIADEHIWYHVLLDQFEGRMGADNAFHWEGEAWAGTDTNRLRFKSEGTVNSRGDAEEGRYELLYSRPITSFFDIQGGIRTDADGHVGRNWAAVGVEGLAPYFLHVSATGYVSGDGHLAGRIEGSYDLLITQRLILQPQLEMNLYSKADPRRALGAGLSSLDTGLRLRYEFTRKFAPYVGLTYEQAVGDTAAIARAAGDPTASLRLTLGIRAWL